MKNIKSSQNRSQKQREMMLEKNLLVLLPMVALPQIVTQLIDSFYNLADTFFVSGLGEAATAAVSINDSLLHLLRSISLAFGVGSASYMSQLLGANRDEEASKVASTTLFTAAFTVAGIALIMFIFLSPFLSLLGAIDSIKGYSMEYGRWTLLFAPFTAINICLSQALRSEGNTKLSMIGQTSGCVINILLDPIFIYTFNLGVAGAAIATGISKIISTCILSSNFLRGKTVLSINPSLISPGLKLYSEIARIGIPSGLRSSMLAIANIVINNLAAGFGEIALASVSVANKCMKLVGAAFLGLGQGFQPVAGYCWGAKKYRRVHTAFVYVSLFGVGLAIVLGTGLYMLAPTIIELFSDEKDMMHYGVILIRSQCITLPMHMWIVLANGLLTATRRALLSGLLGFCRQFFSLIPAAIILTMVFKINGLIVAQAIADIISCLIAAAMVIPLMKRIRQLDRESLG